MYLDCSIYFHEVFLCCNKILMKILILKQLTRFPGVGQKRGKRFSWIFSVLWIYLKLVSTFASTSVRLPVRVCSYLLWRRQHVWTFVLKCGCCFFFFFHFFLFFAPSADAQSDRRGHSAVRLQLQRHPGAVAAGGRRGEDLHQVRSQRLVAGRGQRPGECRPGNVDW